MTNDQLLEKLYEGSLTPDERSLLDTRAAESPEFAAEVQEFMTVVQLLDHEKQEDRTDAVFLESTRSKVITMIAAAGAASAGGAAVQSGGFSALAGNATQWVLALLAAAGVSSVVLWNVWNPAPDKENQRETPEISAPATVGVQPSEPSASIAATEQMPAEPVQQPVSNAPVQSEPLAHHSAAPPPATVPATVPPAVPDEKEAEKEPEQVNAKNPESDLEYQKVLNRNLNHYTTRLEQYKVQKDVKGQAHTLLDIASTERLLKRYSSAMTHARQSLDLWNQIGEADATGRATAYRHIGAINRETDELAAATEVLTQGINLVETNGSDDIRGLLLGELAKVYMAQGNKKLAFEKMYACVVLLRRTNNPELGDWERELRQLESSMK